MVKLIRLILIVLTLGLITFVWPAPAKGRVVNPYNESYFTDILAKDHGFIQKKHKLVDRFKPDLWFEDYVIEVDWEHKMYEALGQSLAYAYAYDKKPAVIILDDIDKNVNYEKFLPIFEHYGVKVWIVTVFKDTGELKFIKEA